MEDIKMSLEAIRTQLGWSRGQMAEALEVTVDRYSRLARGESSMLANELIRLHEASGIPYENIRVPE